MKNRNGAAKNLQVVRGEITDWAYEMRTGLSRLKNTSLKMDNDDRLDHVLINFIEETFDKLPRTMTYSLVIYLLACAIRGILS